jgi:Flavodoxin domain
MRALIVYESMYGNTHAVASHIADGLRPRYDVAVVAVGDATAQLPAPVDLLVVGGPTHVHGMSSETSRKSARETATKQGEWTLDPDAAGPGLRDWFHLLGDGHGAAAAAFDTRIDAPAALTGRASKGIARRLRSHGFHLVTHPESFLVDKHNRLLAGEDVRAAAWGATLAGVLEATRPSG